MIDTGMTVPGPYFVEYTKKRCTKQFQKKDEIGKPVFSLSFTDGHFYGGLYHHLVVCSM
jgi:hypothetical protein